MLMLEASPASCDHSQSHGGKTIWQPQSQPHADDDDGESELTDAEVSEMDVDNIDNEVSVMNSEAHENMARSTEKMPIRNLREKKQVQVRVIEDCEISEIKPNLDDR
jgi:hypothetical protein